MSKKEKYAKFLKACELQTPSLDDYRKWVEYDSNLPWRLEHGDLLNLLEEAIWLHEERGW